MNTSIDLDAKFGTVRYVFDANYLNPREEIERTLRAFSLKNYFELTDFHQAVPGDRKAHSNLIGIIDRSGITNKKAAEKFDVSRDLERLGKPDASAYEAIEFALERRFISKSDSQNSVLTRQRKFLKESEGGECARGVSQTLRGWRKHEASYDKEVGYYAPSSPKRIFS